MSNRSNRNKGGANKKQSKAPVQELKEIEVCYWSNPVYFSNPKFGLQEGLVTKEAAAEYERVTPDATKLEDAVLDYDPKAKKIKEAKKRASNVEK